MNNQDNTPYLVWDTTEILNAKAKHLIETGEADHDEEGFTIACADPYLLNDEWECLTNDLSEKLKAINPVGYWHMKAKNFGWQNLSGTKDFEADNGKTFLSEILPKTECTFRIYIDSTEVIKIQNFHHDSPVGNEWYTVVTRDA